LRRIRDWLDIILFEIRLSLRSLRRQPGFTVVVLLTLTIGIGSNLAIFNLFYPILLQPLPFPDSDRLIVIAEQAPAVDPAPVRLSYPDVRDFAAGNTALAGLAGFWYSDFTCSGQGSPEKLKGCMVSGSFTDILGVQPLLGRGFRSADEHPEAADVVLISEGLWRRKWGGDPDILGTSITFANIPFTIIGIMPASFSFPEQAEVWTPVWKVFLNHGEMFRDSRDFLAVGRMKEGISIAAARHDLQLIADSLAEQFPASHNGLEVQLTPIRAWIFSHLRHSVVVLYWIVSLLLLLACANVSSLLMARNAARRSEISLRMALGAGRARVLGQLMSETMLLAIAGGGLGFAIGWWGRSIFFRQAPVGIPVQMDVSFSPGLVILIAGIIAGTGVLFGLLPAISTVRSGQWTLLPSSRTRCVGTSASNRQHHILVSFETALAVIVLISAFLMLKSMVRQVAVEPGFTPENRISLYVTVPGSHDITGLYRELVDEVATIPGLAGVSTVTELPTGRITRTIQGYPLEMPPASPDRLPSYPVQISGAEYFSVMGIPILLGRGFREQDRLDGAQPVVVINDVFARRYWPGTDPVGQRLHLVLPPGENMESEIIGVCADTPNRGWGEPAVPAIHLLFDQVPEWDTFLIAHTDLDPTVALENIRRRIRAAYPHIPLSLFRPLTGAIRDENWQIPLYGRLFLVAALVTTLLAATGIYSVTTYAVSSRVREFGIRMALGVSPGHLIGWMFRQGLRRHIAGLAMGIPVALVSGRFMASLLFQVQPSDAGVFLGAIFVLTIVAAVAGWRPLLRISRLTVKDILDGE